MAKIYSKKALVSKMKPEKEIVSFLLNYSKALSIIKIEGKNIEIIAN